MSNYPQYGVPAGPPPSAPPEVWWKSRQIIGGVALLVGAALGGAIAGGGADATAAATSTTAGKPAPTVTVSVPADKAPAESAPAAEVTVTAPAPPARTVQVPGPVKTVTAPPPGPAAAIDEDGMWLVGTDIKPGTYRSSSEGSCYWARLKNTNSELDSILANGNGGNQLVTVKKTDKALESARCAPWTRIR
ncbi:hypothetical protein [Kribbella sp. CA-293567]|uniref:hypothetical protein n=1 Tax=Kribbella sp. CA-293567 TaxID=3002436 RepID=UPI0022DE60C1|nr:hypothetical protein [Kribbella sp. CA-293567]WBQ05079.1 hypothetical protein OX958_34660 [Kribbella sp. CA-293567]